MLQRFLVSQSGTSLRLSRSSGIVRQSSDLLDPNHYVVVCPWCLFLSPGELDAGSYEYAARVPALCSAGDYTPRLTPYHSKRPDPARSPYILWQR